MRGAVSGLDVEALPGRGSSSTCWKACCTRWAFLICGIVRSLSALKYAVAGACTDWIILLEHGRRTVMLIPRKRGRLCQGFIDTDFIAATSSLASLGMLNQSTKCWMPTIRMASSTYGSHSVSKPEANISRRPSSKTTNRASRRPVRCTSFGSELRQHFAERRQAGRASST